MHNLALGVEVIKGKQKLFERRLEQDFGVPACRVSQKEILPAIPHGLLDKAVMLVAITRERERVENGPDMSIARVRRIRST